MFFRDRTLSDLIGFQYMHDSARDGAEDLIRRIKEMAHGDACTCPSFSTARTRGTTTRTAAVTFCDLFSKASRTSPPSRR